ncbi:MAG: DUF2877 domain-containing protein [Coriobacteriales bacterium]|nr:DUF2877 domain-containing protein [Coriobacteriales bacterium]
MRDELLALALPQAGGSSRFLCLNRLPRVAVGDGLRFARTALVIGAARGAARGAAADGTRVGLEGVPLWEGPLPPHARATPTPRSLAAFADAMCRLEIPEAVQRALPDAARSLAGAPHGNSSLTPRTATRLIGLGPGLTPAGDDVLLGYLAMDAHVGHDPAWTQAMHAAVAGGLARTTTLSRQLLQNALEADYHETLQRVLAVVCGLSSENLLCSLRRLAAVGASSGACTVFGMWLALQRSVSEREREPISREVTSCTHCHSEPVEESLIAKRSTAVGGRLCPQSAASQPKIPRLRGFAPSARNDSGREQQPRERAWNNGGESCIR